MVSIVFYSHSTAFSHASSTSARDFAKDMPGRTLRCRCWHVGRGRKDAPGEAHPWVARVARLAMAGGHVYFRKMDMKINENDNYWDGAENHPIRKPINANKYVK